MLKNDSQSQGDVLVVAACEETISSKMGCSAIFHPTNDRPPDHPLRMILSLVDGVLEQLFTAV